MITDSVTDIRENVALHDPEVYEDVRLTPSGRPRCPVCGSILTPSSRCENNNMWRCGNYREDEGSWLCSFIEGKFSRKKRLLWDCRYEPHLIFCN